MKKTFFVIFAVLIMFSVNTLPGFADRAGNDRKSGDYRGSGHDRDGHYRGSGDYRGSGYYHGPRYSYGGSIWIGPGWLDPWWGYPYYSYPYYPYPYYPEPPVVTQEQPQVYVEPAPQQEEESYWYYCPKSKGYYPYVKKCPEGWLRVVPSPVPQDKGE
jgi:hypothetical protein